MSPHLSIYWNRSSLIKVQLNDNNDEWRMIYSIKENKRNVHKNSRVGLLKSHLRIVVFSLNWLIKLIKSSKKLQKPTEPSLVIYYIFIRWNNVALFSSSTKWMRPKKKRNCQTKTFCLSVCLETPLKGPLPFFVSNSWSTLIYSKFKRQSTGSSADDYEVEFKW